jgi:energy-coupling factor transporter transmembrane protein EcfT
MVTYRSKIGFEVLIPVVAVIVGLTTKMLYDKAWVGLLLMLPVFALIVHMLLTTYYVVNGQMLHIKSGWLINLKVDVSTIKKIRETKNILSAAATSLNRLEISYGKFDDVQISPKDKAAFIDHLVRINSAIVVELKQHH